MKFRLGRFVIVAAVLVEMWWALEPRDVSNPRSKQTVEAIHVYHMSPSAETKSAMMEQMRRDVTRNEGRAQVWFALMLVADAAAIYLFWNSGVKKIESQPAAGGNAG